MTAQRVAEARAVEEAMCDSLTGLSIETFFEDRVVAVLDRYASGRHLSSLPVSAKAVARLFKAIC